jgi:RNA polymerase sigma-70 factor (ECF subfamily)
MSTVRTNEEWIRALSGTKKQQDEAIRDLRQYLLQVSVYTLYRYMKDIHALSPSERLALAEDCTQEALITVLDHLDEFKGESKFTTWAFKFAVNVSLSSARREGGKQISLKQLSESADRFDWFISRTASAPPDAELQVLQAEVTAVLDDAIQHDLTDKQRMVFKLIVFEQVPMDAIVQRLGTNRNAVYKLLHDSRKKLKQALQANGFKLDEIYRIFGK